MFFHNSYIMNVIRLANYMAPGSFFDAHGGFWFYWFSCDLLWLRFFWCFIVIPLMMRLLLLNSVVTLPKYSMPWSHVTAQWQELLDPRLQWSQPWEHVWGSTGHWGATLFNYVFLWCSYMRIGSWKLLLWFVHACLTCSPTAEHCIFFFNLLAAIISWHKKGSICFFHKFSLSG